MINLTDLENHLLEQGLSTISKDVAEIAIKQALTWKIEDTRDPNETNAIIAFSFGFRFDSNSNRVPGPINEQLAVKVKNYSDVKPRPVYAQWEICEALKGLGGKVPNLTSICPKIDRKNGTPIYLSTKGVLEHIREKLEPMKSEDLGSVFIIAHRDHLVRCARLAQDFGFPIVTAQDDMPDGYDPQSGQLWTTSRTMYIVSDVISRLAAYREDVLSEKKITI